MYKQFSIYCSLFFGIPSITKYMEKKTAMARSTDVPDFVSSPTVTIIPPWKVQFDRGSAAINCTKIHNTSAEVWKCILDHTYNISDVILYDSE